MEADLDKDGKISFEEFTKMVENTDVSMSMTLGKLVFWVLNPTLLREGVFFAIVALHQEVVRVQDARCRDAR